METQVSSIIQFISCISMASIFSLMVHRSLFLVNIWNRVSFFLIYLSTVLNFSHTSENMTFFENEIIRTMVYDRKTTVIIIIIILKEKIKK